MSAVLANYLRAVFSGSATEVLIYVKSRAANGVLLEVRPQGGGYSEKLIVLAWDPEESP